MVAMKTKKTGYEQQFLDAATKGSVSALKELVMDGNKISLKNHDEITDGDGRTALMLASESGSSKAVNFLIENNVNLNGKNDYGETALHEASFHGHVDVIKDLTEKGAKVDEKNNRGFTPLHFAIEEGKLAAVKILLEKGADPHLKNNSDVTPLDLAKEKGHADVILQHDRHDKRFLEAAKLGYLNIIENLTTPRASGQKPNISVAKHNEITDDCGFTALHLACSNNHLPVVEYLVQKGVDPDQINMKNFFTGLHYASRSGHADITRVLLEKGAGPNMMNIYGETALHLAASNGHLQVTQLLLKKGANPNIEAADVAKQKGHDDVANAILQHIQQERQRETRTIRHRGIPPPQNTTRSTNQPRNTRSRGIPNLQPINDDSPPRDRDVGVTSRAITDPTTAVASMNHHDNSSNESNENVETQFLEAAKSGDSNLMEELARRTENQIFLLHDIIVDQRGRSALHWASMNDHLEIIKYLLQNDVNVNTESNDSAYTALHFACRNGSVDIIQTLLENGAELNKEDESGFTPLHVACMYNKLNAVKTLLAKGANPEIQDLNKCTAIDVARQYKCSAIVDEIFQHTQQDHGNAGTQKIIPLSLPIDSQNDNENESANQPPTKSLPQQQQEQQFIAKRAFQAQDEGFEQLSFPAGALIWAKTGQKRNAWWHGTFEGKQGYFPSTYVSLYDHSHQNEAQTVSKQPEQGRRQRSVPAQSRNTRQPPSASTTTTRRPMHDDEPDPMIQTSRDLLQNAIDHPESIDKIQNLSSQYILNCTQNLAESNLIGNGAFGKVYLAEDPKLKMSKSKFAVKVFDFSKIEDKNKKIELNHSYKKEVATLKRFRHPNIITLYATSNLSSQNDQVALVMEYANKGSLASFLQDDANRARLTADIRISIMFQLARSIHFLHTGGQGLGKVLHRDIKPSNICLTDNFQVKLIDCGLAKLIKDPSATESQLGSLQPSFFTSARHGPVGTRGYMCPIYDRTNECVEGSDVFSLGVVFAELIIGCLQGGQAKRNDKSFGLMYDTYVWNISENDNIVDGDEKLVEDADPAIIWDPNTVQTISKIAIQCMAPAIKQRKTTLDLVNELNQILEQITTSESDEATDDKNDADSPDLSVNNLPIESDANADASPCWLCNRNMADTLKCSEGHDICGDCAGEHILNHYGQDNATSDSSPMLFGCCISGCKSKPFCNDDLRRVLSPEALVVYNMKRNHNEQLQQVYSMLKSMQQELSLLKPIHEDVVKNQTLLMDLSDQLERSVMTLSTLTVEASEACPNLVWMAPSNKVTTFRQDPKKWVLQKTISQTYKVAFICQHSWKFAHKPFEITVPRDWVVKLAPLLEVGLLVLKAVAASQDISLSMDKAEQFHRDVEAMKEFVDSVVPGTQRDKIADAVQNAGTQTQRDMVQKGELCNLVGTGLKWLKEKANKTKNLKKWSGKIVPVPIQEEENRGGLRSGAIKWVMKEYKDTYNLQPPEVVAG